MKFLGQMPVRVLNDRQIRPTEYRRWDDARRRFERRDKDRATVEDYARKILDGAEYPPLTLGVSDRHPDVYVADGHHRAIALMQTGADAFPFHWYWIRWAGVHMERGPFPYHLLGL